MPERTRVKVEVVVTDGVIEEAEKIALEEVRVVHAGVQLEEPPTLLLYNVGK